MALLGMAVSWLNYQESCVWVCVAGYSTVTETQLLHSQQDPRSVILYIPATQN